MKSPYQINDFIPDPNTHKNRWQVYDIKEGGMGWVYIVYDHNFGEPFAVKTYKETWLQTKEIKEKFYKEALVWINLDKHLNITNAQFIEIINNKICLFLEFVSGGDLSHYIGTKFLDLKQILKFAIQFCYGMEHAMAHGIVCHRDIKPSNCLVTEDKILKITDFGLVKALESNINLFSHEPIKNKNHTNFNKTKTGEIGGTPYYMAPEQFDDLKHTDVRSDIYSFGVMMYEMLNGKLPFYGNSLSELKDKHQNEDIPDISFKLKENEKPLVDIIYKCLEKESNKRYTNFNDLLSEFINIYKFLFNEIPASPPKGRQLNLVELIRKGNALCNLKHYEESIEYFNKVLNIDSKSKAAWINKGFTLSKCNRSEESLKCFTKALEIDPKFDMAWYNKGVELKKLNRYDEAIECFNHTISINPNYIDAWYNKGVILESLGSYEEAIKCFDIALTINSKMSDIWNNKGATLFHLNRLQEAIECFNNTLKINSKDVFALSNKGAILTKFNKSQDAIPFFNLALQIDPKNAIAWLNKGVALVQLNDLHEALKCFKQAKELGNSIADQGLMLCQQLIYQEEN